MCSVPGGPPASIASSSNTRAADSITGRSESPQVPPSTSSTSPAVSRARSSLSAASPRPSSPTSGFPSPMTTVPPTGWLLGLVHILDVGTDEPSTAHDGRDRSRPLQQVGPQGEIDVYRDEDQEHPREHGMHEAHDLDAAEQRHR